MAHFILGVKCPKCLSHSIQVSDIQSWERGRLWECTNCHYDDVEQTFIQNEPKGCITVTAGKDVE